MRPMKRFAKKSDQLVQLESPIDFITLSQRKADYDLLPPNQFAKKYRDWERLISFTWNGKTHAIQANHCDNPYCKWFGECQHRFTNVKNKPSKYTIGRTASQNQVVCSKLVCNPDPLTLHVGKWVWGCKTTLISNWALAEEIHRLITVNSVVNWDIQYNFHKSTCAISDHVPGTHPKSFKKAGLGKRNGLQLRCKTCLKTTTLLPERDQAFTYHQKRNEILTRLAKILLSKTPVRRTLEQLEIGASTFYWKMEQLYLNALTILEKLESRFSDLHIERMWLCTDKLIYHLNNIRKKGFGDDYSNEREAKIFPTNIVVSADMNSRYVFRSDVCYDWHVTLDELESHSTNHCDDHLDDFERKFARLRMQYAPQPPTQNDTQSHQAYEYEKFLFDRRKEYVDGLHTKGGYTEFAHLWLIKEQLNVDQWRLVSDDDDNITRSMYRVFKDEIQNRLAHHFLYHVDREQDGDEAKQMYYKQLRDLKTYGIRHQIPSKDHRVIAQYQLREIMLTKPFVQHVNTPHGWRTRWSKRFVNHPLPTIDKGIHQVSCTTDITDEPTDRVANWMYRVNDHAVSEFLQLIRRRITTLERPVVTARKDGKSYIYCNFNPKYAQMMVTILRFYYNFCVPFKYAHEKEEKTPAQRIGLVNKVYVIDDLVYPK